MIFLRLAVASLLCAALGACASGGQSGSGSQGSSFGSIVGHDDQGGKGNSGVHGNSFGSFAGHGNHRHTWSHRGAHGRKGHRSHSGKDHTGKGGKGFSSGFGLNSGSDNTGKDNNDSYRRLGENTLSRTASPRQRGWKSTDLKPNPGEIHITATHPHSVMPDDSQISR